MNRFLVRALNGKWDEVTEHVFALRKFVVEPGTTTPRYGDQSIVIEGGSFTITGKIPSEELGKLCRFLQVIQPTGTYPAIVTEPETVQIIRGNSTKLHVLKTGDNWTKISTPKSKDEDKQKAA
jgi:hypothetical protein